MCNRLSQAQTLRRGDALTSPSAAQSEVYTVPRRTVRRSRERGRVNCTSVTRRRERPRTECRVRTGMLLTREAPLLDVYLRAAFARRSTGAVRAVSGLIDLPRSVARALLSYPIVQPSCLV